MENAEWIEHFSGFSYAIERIWNEQSVFMSPKQFLETSCVSLFGLLNAFDRGLQDHKHGRISKPDQFLIKEIELKESYREVKNATLLYSSDNSRTVAIISFDADGFLTYKIHMVAVGLNKKLP